MYMRVSPVYFMLFDGLNIMLGSIFMWLCLYIGIYYIPPHTRVIYIYIYIYIRVCGLLVE